jgi:hypothetical protein
LEPQEITHQAKTGSGAIFHFNKDSPACPLRISPPQSKRVIPKLTTSKNALDPTFMKVSFEYLRVAKSDKEKSSVRN